MTASWPAPPRPLSGPQALGLALLALAAGLAQALALAWPGDGQPRWWLQTAGLAALLWGLQRVPRARHALALGWLGATAWLAGSFWWLFISMHTYGGLPAPLAVLAVLGLAAFLGLYHALACGVFKALALDGWGWNALLFVALWTLAELVHGRWLTGFPWGAGGYAQLDGPLAGWAPWLGVYGVGALSALCAAALVAWRPRTWLGPSLLLVLPLAGGAGLRAWQPDAGSQGTGRVAVTLLQGNIPQDEKFMPGSGVPLALAWYAEQLQAARTPLVVAPETAVPLLPLQLPPGYWEGLARHFSQGERAALLGLPLGNRLEGYTNSVAGLAPGQRVPYRYDKHHLVPFGEFVPPFFRWFTELMNIPLGDFNRGALGQPSFAWAGQRWAPNICYEDLFGEELGARFADPAQAPTVFVNVSNIGWFGDSLAIDQHLQISRMRALEFARPMLRATNTGATVAIDHRGQVTHALPRLTRAALEAEVEGRSGLTPYAHWVSRWGLGPLWALCGLGLLLGGLAAWRRRR